MKRYLYNASLLVLMIVCGTVSATAQQTQPAKPSAPQSSFRNEVLRQLDDAKSKFLALAQAVPQEKYSWRPGEGVRSTSEVYTHVATSNYVIPVALGFIPPTGLHGELDRITNKAEVIKILKESFEYVRQVIEDTPDTALDKTVKLFGNYTTVRDVFLTLAVHAHEHLGQSVAYARMNNIVPPWTAAREGQHR